MLERAPRLLTSLYISQRNVIVNVFYTDDTGFFFVSPVVLEAGRVVVVKDVSPAVDVNNASGHCDEQHQCELDHVTDLNQHGGGHQC